MFFKPKGLREGIKNGKGRRIGEPTGTKIFFSIDTLRYGEPYGEKRGRRSAGSRESACKKECKEIFYRIGIYYCVTRVY